MTPNEELDLSLHVRAGDQQAESSGSRLVEANLQLVVSIAERHRDSGVHILDLIQKGNEGLLLALETFAASSSDRFSAHAAACVDYAIANHVAELKLKSDS